MAFPRLAAYIVDTTDGFTLLTGSQSPPPLPPGVAFRSRKGDLLYTDLANTFKLIAQLGRTSSTKGDRPSIVAAAHRANTGRGRPCFRER